MRTYRADPDSWERRGWDLAAVPGQDVLALPVGLLRRLPAPWRLRIDVGDATIDACSVVMPGTWSGAELVYLLAGVLLGRVTRAQVVQAARLRLRITAGERWSWEKVSAGLVGIEPATVEGCIGDALERIGARLVGAWSGVEAEIGEEHGEEEQAPGPVRRVRSRARKPRGAVPKV